MTTSIKAIETVYNGYRLRSRLEARWAVFFDTLGIHYEYEKEGYNLGKAGWYLPDFWLPDQKCWIEIKSEIEYVAVRKCRILRGITGSSYLLIVGNPWPDEYYVIVGDEICNEGICEFQDCRRCDGIGLEGIGGNEGFVSSWICTCHPDRWKGNKGSKFSTKVNTAYAAARQARFEHGERPQ